MTAILLLASWSAIPGQGAEATVLDPAFHHLRNAEPLEWNHFPEKAEAAKLDRTFDLEEPTSYKLLTLRQADVKQTWDVTLNGRKLGVLDRDDNDLEHALPIPEKALKEVGNKLEIATRSDAPDDIRLGEIALHRQSRDELAREAEVTITVTDATTNSPLPCRLTIVDAKSNKLVLLGAKSDDQLAVRAGVVYTIDGRAQIGIRPGRYKVWAGRGFEYSLGEATFEMLPGDKEEIALSLRREVETPGLAACDTHLHTNEFARHGDATLVERLITLAGEGIELPISTEHDQHIDYAPEARRIGADKYYTPVIGCEVTTQLGHFNSFPIEPGSAPAQHRLRPWPQIFGSIFGTPGVRVVILNHPRDVHSDFRPLDPARFDAKTGRFTDGRDLKANGLEVINSGAQQSDPMQLVHDWMALLRSGKKIAAVGSSDSHTVNFAIVGQARTYIQCRDNDPANINVDAAVNSFLEGRTHVSFGLLTLLALTGDGGVTANVLGPGWTRATKLTLFADGQAIDEIEIPEETRSRAGLKFAKSWSLEDLGGSGKARRFLVAVAEGPGIAEPWWRMMPPYQADTPEYKPYVMGISPAVWLEK
jgi:hypothetical protein